MSEAAAAVGLSRLLSDERLTKRAVSGDERAFAAIFRRYHQPLFRFCLAIVGNPEDAQDALQNTMIKVLRALPGEERKIELKPWLYRIAHNESIDLIRRRRETRELDVEQAAPGYVLAEDAATRERLRRLLTDLRELPERQREVLVMRELGGLDFEEIGTALQTSGAVARQTLYEARQSLRQMEEGREMSCEAVMKALSDGDGRVTRRRDVRAHLRSCADCRAFRDEIKGRAQDLAAISPLPAVAAAGMLQGLVGGSSAATGGGLAAALGGGAGVSAVTKGVATVAVTAAIGVTAADRTGVIHVLPGGGDAKSGESAPVNHHNHNGHVGSGSQTGSGNKGMGSGSANGQGNQGGNGNRGDAGQVGAHGKRAHGNGKGYGPGASHPSGQGHEKQHPPAASRGQETADAAKPPPRESPSAAEGGGGQPPTPKPSRPEPAPNSPPKEAPASPPAAAPATPPQAQAPPASTPQPTAEAVAPEPSNGAGKGSEKKP
jgi:RNA polymerase sigma factor (sigma-70 family)